ncbi:manganese-dependent ADP-ribose/CDP-alcohol diphosphatase isoform X2 [Nematolebias whitei]|uniref:manganese-dependent ADP-ribose/CDP-alcohol diphosphatase isoform X2 n=1 Tax=Nematolebias whitei TaxID=451745 RepID=UPI0018995164|nr:manganese-dependent ADP-ribose/CDP-alcohol diphosphatase isoform X2 [Nematolebias whitei]
MDRRPTEPPLFTFGVIADIQYADIDDGYNYTRTNRRYYRTSLQLLKKAQKSWSESEPKPDFVLQLGDVIDGLNVARGASDRALDKVLAELSSGPGPVHHVWGNHELYNFSRSALMLSRLNSKVLADQSPTGTPARSDIYAYQFCPVPGFRFVIMDSYDVGLLGREESSEQYQEAKTLIQRYNKNQDLNCPPVQNSDPYVSDSEDQGRFTMFNGGFSPDQLDWLDSVLSSADGNQEKVTLVSHLPVHPYTTDSVCLAWNFEELLAIIRSHSSVVCYMAGHVHDGAYHQDESTRVHHLTMDGVIETPPHSAAFCTVSVYSDRMVLKGSGRVMDRVFLF